MMVVVKQAVKLMLLVLSHKLGRSWYFIYVVFRGPSQLPLCAVAAALQNVCSDRSSAISSWHAVAAPVPVFIIPPPTVPI